MTCHIEVSVCSRREMILCWGRESGVTHHHAEPNLLAAVFLLDRLVQYDVQEDLCPLVLHVVLLRLVPGHSHIVSTEYTDDLSAPVKLDKQPLVEILASSVS